MSRTIRYENGLKNISLYDGLKIKMKNETNLNWLHMFMFATVILLMTQPSTNILGHLSSNFCGLSLIALTGSFLSAWISNYYAEKGCKTEQNFCHSTNTLLTIFAILFFIVAVILYGIGIWI